jgi:hypothetical protein
MRERFSEHFSLAEGADSDIDACEFEQKVLPAEVFVLQSVFGLYSGKVFRCGKRRQEEAVGGLPFGVRVLGGQ